MQKIWQKKLVSAKYVRDKCKLIRCSKTQENEPWTQNPQTSSTLRKDLEKKDYHVNFYYFWKTKHIFEKQT